MTTLVRMRRLLVVLFALLNFAVVSPVVGAEFVVTDPAGDGLEGDALDITDMRIVNGDRAIVVTTSVVRVAAGSLGVRILARGDRPRQQVLVFSNHFGKNRNYGLVTIDGRQRCPRLRVAWDFEYDTVKIRLPSACFHHGRYGAIRAKVIAEIGSDADYAPKTRAGEWHWSRLVRRG